MTVREAKTSDPWLTIILVAGTSLMWNHYDQSLGVFGFIGLSKLLTPFTFTFLRYTLS